MEEKQELETLIKNDKEELKEYNDKRIELENQYVSAANDIEKKKTIHNQIMDALGDEEKRRDMRQKQEFVDRIQKKIDTKTGGKKTLKKKSRKNKRSFSRKRSYFF